MHLRFFLLHTACISIIFTGIFTSPAAQALSPLELAQWTTRVLTPIFGDLYMGSAKAEGPWNVFMHKTYRNLSDLFRDTHTSLTGYTFSSPTIDYIFNKTDILSIKFWVVTISCIYITQKLARFCYHTIRRAPEKREAKIIISYEDGETRQATLIFDE